MILLLLRRSLSQLFSLSTLAGNREVCASAALRGWCVEFTVVASEKSDMIDGTNVAAGVRSLDQDIRA